MSSPSPHRPKGAKKKKGGGGLLLKLSDLKGAGHQDADEKEREAPKGSPANPSEMYKWDVHSDMSNVEAKLTPSASSSSLASSSASAFSRSQDLSSSGQSLSTSGGGLPMWGADSARGGRGGFGPGAGGMTPTGLETKTSAQHSRGRRDPTVGSWEWRQRKKAYREEVDSTPYAKPLDPKVFVPYVTPPGHTPRHVRVDQSRARHATADLGTLLLGAGVSLSDIVGPSLDGLDGMGDAEGAPVSSSLAGLLPIEIFDDTTTEMYEPAEWVERGRPEPDAYARTPARTLCPEDGAWRPCVVTGMVAADSTTAGVAEFEVAVGGQEELQRRRRLSVCFDAESPEQFVHRVSLAVLRRRMADSLIRYGLFVDCMPTDEVSSLSEEQIGRIMEMTMTSSVGRFEGNQRELLNEVHADFCRTMNQVIFDANFKGPVSVGASPDTFILPPQPGSEPPMLGLAVQVRRFGAGYPFQCLVMISIASVSHFRAHHPYLHPTHHALTRVHVLSPPSMHSFREVSI